MWAEFVKIGLGIMQMRPDDFWNLSPRELWLALSGFKQFHSSSESNAPMRKDELDNLMELYPDG
jgi:uncharacterized phage protein (TIGR02216 family)